MKAAAVAASEEAEALTLAETLKEEAEVFAKLKAQGVVLSAFDDAARADFLKLTAPMYEEYFRGSGAAGRSLVDYLKQLK